MARPSHPRMDDTRIVLELTMIHLPQWKMEKYAGSRNFLKEGEDNFFAEGTSWQTNYTKSYKKHESYF